MDSPPEIAEIVAEILETGILRIRSFAWSSMPDLCAIEADHIHNLPSLLRDFTVEKLRYYWEVEHMSYMERAPLDHLTVWEPLWERLRRHVELTETIVSARS